MRLLFNNELDWVTGGAAKAAGPGDGGSKSHTSDSSDGSWLDQFIDWCEGEWDKVFGGGGGGSGSQSTSPPGNPSDYNYAAAHNDRDPAQGLKDLAVLGAALGMSPEDNGESSIIQHAAQKGMIAAHTLMTSQFKTLCLSYAHTYNPKTHTCTPPLPGSGSSGGN